MSAQIHWIRTSKILVHVNPFEGCWPDLDRPITFEEIERCLDEGREVLHEPFEMGSIQSRDDHIEKISWFVRNGFSDPLEIDVGCPCLDYYNDDILVDGNHRFASAVFRSHRYGNDPLLPVYIGGQIDYAQELGLWDEKVPV